jgi:hypothetical protein
VSSSTNRSTKRLFYGRDELEIFYENATQNYSKAISTAYLAPAITPFSGMNPGFRYVLKRGAGTYM